MSKQCLPRAAVSAVIIENDKILLVKRGCEPNMGLWSLPGGSIEPGETLKEALAREVLEETSQVVEVGDVAAAHEVITRDGDEILFHYVIINLYARVLSGDLKAASDAADARWVNLTDIANYNTTAGLTERLQSIDVL